MVYAEMPGEEAEVDDEQQYGGERAAAEGRTNGGTRIRVMQAFRSAAVSETILRDAGSSAYLARKHFRVANTGFATAATAAASAHSKVKPEPTEEDKIFHTVLSKKAMEDITHA
ncbi:hypothetical protein AB1Y20_003674 [Prymnesium parvum]|uniref:RNA helicase n=1 Tax=Prymnesium parvum TaxID=97485 RepID=A0AB34J796_PRYPA